MHISRLRGRVLAGFVAAISALTLTACASTQDAATSAATTYEPPAPEPPAARVPAPAPSAPVARAPVSKPRPVQTMRFCDANIRARIGTTTCLFAQNVFYSYWLNSFDPGVFADLPGLPAYSRAAGRTFYLHCSGLTTISCRTSDRAHVTFSSAAVLRYTAEQANAYAATHELGDVPAPSDPAVAGVDPYYTPPTSTPVYPAAPDAVPSGDWASTCPGGSCYGAPSDANGLPRTTYVAPYTKSNGTHVGGYYRSSP